MRDKIANDVRWGIIARKQSQWLDTIRTASKHKFSHVELRLDSTEDGDLVKNPSFIEAAGNEAESNNLTLSLHGMDGIDCNTAIPKIRKLMTGMLIEQRAIASALGAKWLTLHAGRGFFRNRPNRKDRELALCAEMIKDVLEASAELRVPIGLENMPRTLPDYGKCWLGDRVEELNYFLEGINQPGLGIIWDFGHANLDMSLNERNDQMKFALSCDKLLGFHLHYNNGKDDLHVGFSAAEVGQEMTHLALLLEASQSERRGFPPVILETSIPEAISTRAFINEAIRTASQNELTGHV